MNKIFIYVVAALAVIMPSFVHSHTLGISGHHIAAVMHMSPSDTPKAGVLSSIYFDFKNTDTVRTFNLADCDCTFSVSQGSMTLASTAVDLSMIQNNTTAKVPYTFPTGGLYKVSITGQPKVANAFESFAIHYDVNVADNASGGTEHGHGNSSFLSMHGIHIVLFGIAIVVSLIIIFKDGKDRK